MPEGSRRSSQRSQHSSGSRRPSSLTGVSSVQGCRGMSSSDRVQSCSSPGLVLVQSSSSPGLVLVQSSSSVDSLSSSSVSLQDTAHSSSSSSLQNGSDISLDLTPIGAGSGVGVVMVTGQPAANQPAAGSGPKPLSRLQRVALEIVETEQAYVRDLKSIVEDYLGCIIECGDVPLKPEQVSALFCNIEDIYEFNSDLLEDLERSPDAAAIADCFVERSEAFDIYTLYCMNYPNSVAVLRECMQDEVLVKFFHQRQCSLNHSLPLETYLLKPVQRILKYHLLLQELSKHLSKADPGYEVVEDAIVAMTAVAWYINDMKRKQEHAVRLQEIEALLVNWSGPDLAGFGELVLEGSFRVHRVKKERAFFLFDRMLLIAKKRLDHFVYSTHIFCCNLLLVETLKDPLSFKISDQSIPKQQHIVQTRNQEEKRLWVHYLKRLIVENHPASLPQKARQVLGDNFCQTPQFQQEALKSCSNPRLDDIHNFHRGRRPSEPQELLFPPEKSRKSLPLLLEGNLPFRRSRRQSAPAKDIEAVFHSSPLKCAESEGQLCSADSGSCSTLASSVIEIEPELNQDSANPDSTNPGLNQDLNPEQEQEELEEEELVTPPTSLSITEEILQLLNQNRREETEKELQDSPPHHSKHGRSNFTCPLPPVISPCSPEPLPTMQQEAPSMAQQDAQENLPTMQQDPEEDEETREEQDGVQQQSDEESLVESKTVFEDQESPTEQANEKNVPEEADEQKQEKTNSDANSEPEIPKTQKDEAVEVVKSCANEDVTVQRRPTRGSQRRKRDKNIIEKIRSYYEAAAEAEDDGEMEEEGENDEEGSEERRRSSVSQIPSGFVRESVTLFSSNTAVSKMANREEYEGGDVERQNGGEIYPEVNGDVFEEGPEKRGDGDRAASAQNADAKQVSSEQEVCLSEEAESVTSHEETEERKNKTAAGPRVGRWSRHSRIVSANRALFEGMASDVARIGLFEASPVVDPVLLENSERILNKVQTLARMYSEKASRAKAQQHQQQRWAEVFSQSWSSRAGRGSACSDQTKNRTRTQAPSKRSPREEQRTGREEEERRDPPAPFSADHVTLSEQLSSNDIASSKSRDVISSPGPDGGSGPGLTQDRSSVLGHTSSDRALRSSTDPDPQLDVSTEPQQSVLQSQEGSAQVGIPSSAHVKISSRLVSWDTGVLQSQKGSAQVAVPSLAKEMTPNNQIIPSAPDPIALSQPDNPEESVKVRQNNLLEEPRSRQTCPAMTRELPENKAPPLGNGNPDVSLWKAGSLTQGKQNNESPELSHHQNSPSDVAAACVFDHNEEGKVGMGLPAQFLEEQVMKAAKSAQEMSTETFTVTGPGLTKEAQNEAPYVGCQSPNTPLMSYGGPAEECQELIRELPQTVAPYLGYKSKNEINDQPSSPVARPGFAEFQSQQDASHLGFQSPDAPLMSYGDTSKERQEFTDELPQKLAPYLGCKSRNETNDQQRTSMVAHPSFTGIQAQNKAQHLGYQSRDEQPNTSAVANSVLADVQAQKEAPHLGFQTRDVPLSNSGGPGLTQLPLPSSSSPVQVDEVRGSSVQSPVWPKDSLPTLTDRRPTDLHERTTATVCERNERREQSTAGPSPRPSSRPTSDSPALAALLPTPSLTSASRPDLHPRCPSPAPNTRTQCQDPPRPADPGLRTSRPSPASAFTRSLAASCISQTISQSMSKKSPLSDKPFTPAPLPLTYHLRQRSPSPKLSTETNQHPRSFLWSPQSLANHPQRHSASPTFPHANANNNNNIMGSAFSSPHADPHLDSSLWASSHNRVARPFCASEPNSRVQSPTSFSHGLSTPSASTQLANKPPNPRRPGSGHNPLGLTLDINRASSVSCNSSLSPRIMSPPPIGVSVNAWANHIATPQPRNARYSPCTSPTLAYSGSLRNLRNASPSAQPSSSLRRSHSTTLADRPPSPVRRSWAFTGAFDQHESGFHSPRSGYSSPALACLSPRASLQSPASPGRFSPARSTFSGQQFTGVPWSDEISRSFVSDQTWGDPELEEGACRSQIICAYISRPPRPPAHHHLHHPHSTAPAATLGLPPPSPAKPAGQRTSYATTVNLQIAGSGRIKSFSTAQVSLTQTLQNGAQPQGALTRRVSVHGLPQ